MFPPVPPLQPSQRITEALDGVGEVRLGGLVGSSAAWLLAQRLQQRAGPMLWVTPSMAAAQQIARELSLFAPPGCPVMLYPQWDVAAYKGYSPSAEVCRAQLAARYQLAAGKRPVVVAPVRALLQKVVAADVLLARCETLRVGDELDRDALVGRLIERGYLSCERCLDAGSLAVRGGVLDCFSPGRVLPVRLELWGDEIESIRSFDPYTQRSVEQLSEVVVLPARELVLDAAALERLPARLKALSDERGLSPRARLRLQEELLDNRVLQELELLVPLLEGPLCDIFSYLGAAGDIVWQQPERIAAELFGEAERKRGLWEREQGSERLLPEPTELFLHEDELTAAMAGCRRIFLSGIYDDVGEAGTAEGEAGAGASAAAAAAAAASQGALERLDAGADPDGQFVDHEAPRLDFVIGHHGQLRGDVLAAKQQAGGMLAPLAARIEAWRSDGARLVIVTPTRGQGEQLLGLLEPYGIDLRQPPPAAGAGSLDAALAEPGSAPVLIRGELRRGFVWPQQGLVVLAIDEVLGRQRSAAKPRRPRGHEAIGSLRQLQRDDLIVHSIHGIGRFRGLSKLSLGATAADVQAQASARAADPRYDPGSAAPLRIGQGSDGQGRAAAATGTDFLLLEYRGGDRLYLPVHKLNLLARYVSAGGKVPRLDKLGGQTWSKRRRKVAEATQKVAAELLELYARRELARSQAYPPPDEYYREFCARFPFEETPDQEQAIEAVIADMSSRRPMDRLVCGDVGFGKTEVALRAAFRAVEAGRQAAVLVPTTLLALQHFEEFKERMESFPVRVEMLSRFRTARQQREILAGLADGQVDVVIGTHRLLSGDITFRNLGLLVVDEEHRFGVKHKERIKELRENVDVLTMTATPIPRTLHMALAGLRDFSFITTPPLGRQSVRTSVVRFSPRRIQEAIRYEVERGGQVFFLHNRVRTIHGVADFLRGLVPEAQLRVAHGQMNERELEDIMLDFYRRRFQVLVCTTIVESGLDVPSANTMIINRADTLGLAQLHQLRGRVGRSHQLGHCLLLAPPGRSLRGVALERLKVIQDNTDLGSGYLIAQQDLELRGAGNLLGKKQSGHIADVGMAAYMELLEAAVRGLRGQETVTGPEPDVELKTDAWIPADYIEDERDRLLQYKRLCDARSGEELSAALAELEDLYGRPPEPVVRFERLIQLKVLCRQLRVVLLRRVRGARLQLTFDPTTGVDPARLIALVQEQSARLSLRQEGVLECALRGDERSDSVMAALALLEQLRTSCYLPPRA
jgi:transcription-repair coupling factor (superfamily II helicase)